MLFSQDFLRFTTGITCFVHTSKSKFQPVDSKLAQVSNCKRVRQIHMYEKGHLLDTHQIWQFSVVCFVSTACLVRIL